MADLIPHVDGHTSAPFGSFSTASDLTPTGKSAKATGQTVNGSQGNGKRAPAATFRRALARVLHDVKSPLTLISCNAQMMLGDERLKDLAPDIVAQLREMEEASHRLAAELDRLADLKEGTEWLSAGEGP